MTTQKEYKVCSNLSFVLLHCPCFINHFVHVSFFFFSGVGPVGAMEILQEFAGEGLEGLKRFK